MTAVGVTLIGRESVAERTTAFHFSKPEGFLFKAGQAIDVILPDAAASAAPGDRHTFSLVSAPFENELVVATRLRGTPFKRVLAALPIGLALHIEGPSGSLTLHNDRARPAVFIAGGIGITPFMSILRQANSDRSPRRLLLIYSNRRPEDAAFLADLQRLEALHRNFRLVATMTEMGKSALSWNGETRRIGADLVKAACRGLAAPIYYLAGPPAMVEAVRQALNQAAIDDDDIRSEAFYGY